MSRDRFVAVEKGVNPNEPFGHDDHGNPLMSRAEHETYLELKAAGYEVWKHGWPDFVAVNPVEDYKVRLVEVKGPGDRLQKSQVKTFAALKLLGIEVDIVTRGRKS